MKPPAMAAVAAPANVAAREYDKKVVTPLSWLMNTSALMAATIRGMAPEAMVAGLAVRRSSAKERRPRRSAVDKIPDCSIFVKVKPAFSRVDKRPALSSELNSFFSSIFLKADLDEVSRSSRKRPLPKNPVKNTKRERKNMVCGQSDVQMGYSLFSQVSS